MAATIIQECWRQFCKTKEKLLLERAKQQHLRKKMAINRIYDFYRVIKVRKVTASALLVQQHLWQVVQQTHEQLGQEYFDKIVVI